MSTPEQHDRIPTRRARDEQAAAEMPLELLSDAPQMPVEAHLQRLRRRPAAVAGVVEIGLVRPLDSAVRLPEHARVIIVATESP